MTFIRTNKIVRTFGLVIMTLMLIDYLIRKLANYHTYDIILLQLSQCLQEERFHKREFKVAKLASLCKLIFLSLGTRTLPDFYISIAWKKYLFYLKVMPFSNFELSVSSFNRESD